MSNRQNVTIFCQNSVTTWKHVAETSKSLGCIVQFDEKHWNRSNQEEFSPQRKSHPNCHRTNRFKTLPLSLLGRRFEPFQCLFVVDPYNLEMFHKAFWSMCLGLFFKGTLVNKYVELLCIMSTCYAHETPGPYHREKNGVKVMYGYIVKIYYCAI